jgi:uncharacterized OB-fold protein
MSAIAPFHPGLIDLQGPPESWHLVASRCARCARHAFPAKHVCLFCGGLETTRVPLSGKGRIYAFARVDLPPSAIGKPYVAAYVDLEERVRIFTQIVDAPFEEVRAGMPVEVVFRKLNSDGADTIAYFCRPAEGT